MIIKKLSRYPIKGMNAEPLTKALLEVGAGIVGDRRFAFGIDETIDDGVWRASRSYLINAVNDNLLKFYVTAERPGWRLQNPQGEVAHLTSDIAGNIDAINASIVSFMSAVSTRSVPRLIDRKNGQGPKGHWDFPDSELLIVNLATVRELEKRWGFEIDPRRFRYNILIDGLPAWSEFESYGARFGVGDAQVDILRPARRCAATGVNPDTGDRDVEILQRLVKDYGHGFFGVYAKVSKAGEIEIEQTLHKFKNYVVSQTQASCDIAPSTVFWPKVATINHSGAHTYSLKPVGDWPLMDETSSGNIKIHLGGGSPVIAEIKSITGNVLLVKIDAEEPQITRIGRCVDLKNRVLISGPFAPRKKR